MRGIECVWDSTLEFKAVEGIIGKLAFVRFKVHDEVGTDEGDGGNGGSPDALRTERGALKGACASARMDYRGLNKVTIANRYPLPNMDELQRKTDQGLLLGGS